MNKVYKQVMTEAAEQCGSTFDEACSEGRPSGAVMARRIAWWILHNDYGWSEKTIAHNAGKWRLATVHRGIEIIDEEPASSTTGSTIERVRANLS